MEEKRDFVFRFFALTHKYTVQLLFIPGLIALISISGCSDSSEQSLPVATPVQQKILEPETQAIATVNGETISIDHFNILYRHELEREKFPADMGMAKAHALRIKQRLSKKLIDDALISQAAKNQNIVIDQSEIASSLKSLADSFPSQEAYSRHVAAYPGGEEGLRNTVMLGLLERHMTEADITPPTDNDARLYYDEHPAVYHVPAHLTIQSIFIVIDKHATDEDKAALRKKAELLQQKASTGKDSFGVLARRHSQHASSRIGGYLGRVTEEKVPPHVWSTLRKLKPGEISSVIEAENGLYILRLVRRNPEKNRDFVSVKDEIKANIRARQISASSARLMIRLRSEAVIENHLNKRYAETSLLALPSIKPQLHTGSKAVTATHKPDGHGG